MEINWGINRRASGDTGAGLGKDNRNWQHNNALRLSRELQKLIRIEPSARNLWGLQVPEVVSRATIQVPGYRWRNGQTERGQAFYLYSAGFKHSCSVGQAKHSHLSGLQE